MEQVPEVPLGVLGLFVILVQFAVDLVTEVYRNGNTAIDLPSWVKNLIGLVVAEALCFALGMDVLATMKWTLGVSGFGMAVTGVLMVATAAKVAHPAEKALMGIGKFLTSPTV